MAGGPLRRAAHGDPAVTGAADPLLTVRNASRRFPNGTVALRDVSLRIGVGEVAALLGPSGCGKSTLLRLIAGLDHPDAGTVAWAAGQPAPGSIGYVFQDATLLPWATAAENVRLPLRLRGQPAAQSAPLVRAALERVGLGGVGGARPTAAAASRARPRPA